jgi:hypothetical protein
MLRATEQSHGACESGAAVAKEHSSDLHNGEIAVALNFIQLRTIARPRSESPVKYVQRAGRMRSSRSVPNMQPSRTEYNRQIGIVLMEDQTKTVNNKSSVNNDILDDLLNLVKCNVQTQPNEGRKSEENIPCPRPMKEATSNLQISFLDGLR